MESYSIEAILSATDSGFTNTMKDAENSMGGLGDKTQKTNTSILDIAKGVGVFKLVESAVSLVSNSVDGAIDRFDTLNKYPVVMEALGYSTEEVEGSMTKLKDGIDGLPTRLDDIVANTQQLAISTGSLDKGTDTAIALNNAFLASGASTADASRGMEQYRQMLGRGEVDMQSFKSVQETMPIAMDKVAKSFEDRGVGSVNELYDALKYGDITFTEFNDRLIELNDGIGGFADLAEKNSKGIKTSMENLKGSVVKGLEATIRAIDEGLSQAGLGGITDILDNLKDGINETFSVLNAAIPPAIGFLASLYKTIEPYLPFLSIIIGYITTYQAVMWTAEKATKAWKWATEGATIAQKLLNVAMSLNPIGLIVAAVIVLVGVIIYLWKTNEDFRDAVINIWNAIKDIILGCVNMIVDTSSNIWEAFKTFISNLWDSIKNNAVKTWESLKNGTIKIFNNTVDGAKNLWSDFKEWIANLVTNLKNSVVDGWESLKSNTVNIFNSLVSSAKEVWQDLKDSVSDTVDRVKSIFNTLREINLWEAGKAIMDSFLEGLKKAWGKVKDFVGGIGDWIRKNKGPIEYDRRLLIPAGEAIMSGLNRGLDDGFGDVQDTVGDMTKFFADTAFKQDFEIGANFSELDNKLRSVNDMDISRKNELTLKEAKTPAEIKLNMGNRVYKAFIDDIDNAIGQNTDLLLEH